MRKYGKNLIRTFAVLLAFALVISGVELSGLLGAKKNSFAGNAVAADGGDNTQNPTFELDLYNFIHVTAAGNNGYGRLRRTTITTTKDLNDLVNASNSPQTLENSDIVSVAPYDFSNEILYLEAKKDYSNLNPFNGTYVWLDDILSGRASYDSDQFTGCYIVGENNPLQAFNKKLGGSGYGFVYQLNSGEEYFSAADIKCIHRDYPVTILKGEPTNQKLYSFLSITGTGVTGHNKNDYYRLSKLDDTIYMSPLSELTTDFSIDESYEYYDQIVSGHYDFSNLELSFGGKTYKYKDADYKPTESDFEPYYQVVFRSIIVSEKVHHGNENWFTDSAGWLDGDGTEWSDVTSNNTKLFHRDYIATLHAPGDNAKIRFYDEDGTSLLQSGNQKEGQQTVYNNELPSKPSDDNFNYVLYWKDTNGNEFRYDELPMVTGAEDYTAVFHACAKLVTVTISGNTDTKTYSGSEQSVSGYDVSISSDLYTEDDFTFSGNDVVNGTDAGTYYSELTADQFTNTNTELFPEVQFVINNQIELTINPAPVTITAKSEAFVYDGASHRNDGYDVDGLVGSDAVSAVVSGSISFPSESPVTNKLESYEFTTGMPGNYRVTTANGQLTMTKASVAITITAASDEWTYDGAAHSNTDVTVTSGSLLEGDALVATATGSVTNVADTANGNNPVAAGYKIMHGEEDVTANYVITVENGTLTINKRSVTLTSESDEKPYDGTPLTNPAVTVGGDGFVYGEVSDIRAIGSVTTVAEGAVTNTITYMAGESFNEENYTITKNEGQLHISPSAKALVITSSTKSWEYDGQTHKDEVYTVSYDGSSIVGSSDGTVYTFTLPTGDKITITPTTGGVIEYSSEGVTNNYIYVLQNPDCYDNVTSNKGTLSITKRPITLTANNASSEYTGSEITYATAPDAVSPYYSITDGSLVEGQSITAIELNGSGVTAGKYDIDISSVQIGDYTHNYDISFVPGKLTISKNSTEITVVPGSDSKMYDGTPLTKNEHEDFTVTGVPEGFTWTAVADGTVTNAVPGEDEKAVNAVTEFKIFDADGNDVTDQFSNIDKSATGTLTITARSVTLTSKSDEKEYDGTPLTSDEITTGGDGFVNGEGCTFDVTGTITNVGSEQNAFTYTLNDGTTATNYSVATEFGTLEITPLEAVLEWSDTKFPYDGENHVPTATVSNLIDGDECKVTVTGEKKEVGEDYVATATELSNPNYKLPEKNTTSFSIYGCVVIFKNDDGTVLAKIGVPFGTKPVYEGDEPTKEPTAQYIYEFDGWTPEIVEVEAEETVYTATYQQKTRTYTVEPSELPEGVKLSITDKKTVDAGDDVTFTITIEKGYDKGESFAVKVNGKAITPDENGTYKISGILEDVKITVSGVEKVSYSVVEGDKTKHVIGDKNVAKFVFKRNVNDAETFGKNTAILLDGKEMTDAQYTKSSGSLIVELKADFLNTLSVGEHVLTVRFDDYDGDVNARLIIEKAADPAPQTGDTGNLTLWIVIGVVSLVAFLALFLLICKRRKDEEEEEI